MVGAALKKRSARSAARALSSRNFGLYAHGFDGLVGLRRRLQQQYAQLRYENGEQQLALPGFPSQLRDNGNESVREEVIIRNIEADGPERLNVMHQARDLMVAWMPYKVHAHRFSTDLVQPSVQGYHASHFRGLFWKYVDVDPQAQQRAGK